MGWRLKAWMVLAPAAASAACGRSTSAPDNYDNFNDPWADGLGGAG